MISQNVWNMSLFEHFFKVLSLYLEALIWIRIHIRVMRIRNTDSKCTFRTITVVKKWLIGWKWLVTVGAVLGVLFKPVLDVFFSTVEVMNSFSTSCSNSSLQGCSSVTRAARVRFPAETCLSRGALVEDWDDLGPWSSLFIVPYLTSHQYSVTYSIVP